MSWLSSMINGPLERFKERMRRWCQSPDTAAEILSYLPLAVWLHDQPAETRVAVEEALPKILAFMADKWFGG